MKKGLILALAASFVMSAAATAFAFPVDFSGNFKLEGRSINDKSAGSTAKDTSFYFLGTKLNFGAQLDQDTTFFGRISHRSDFGVTTAPDDNQAFDQYGVKIKAKNLDLTIGRQAINLGQGTILNTGSNYAGIDNKFDGIVAATNFDGLALNFIAGKNTAVSGVAKEWYGADVSKKVSENANVGFAYASSKEGTTDALKNWALNASVKVNKFDFNAEYARSNRDADNKAFFVAGTYGVDKDSFTVQYQKVDKYAVDQENSGIGSIAYPMGNSIMGDHNYSGYTYAYSHKMTKTATFNALYLDLKADGKTGNNSELAANVVWNF